MKTFNHDVSVRVKLKSNDSVEVVIMDHDTKEIFYYALNFRKPHIIPKSRRSKCEVEKPDPLPHEENSENLEDTNSDCDEINESEVGIKDDENSY